MIDWDDFLEESLANYFLACYGQREINPVQRKEVSQAFLSGMHQLNQASSEPKENLTEAIKNKLTEMGCLNK